MILYIHGFGSTGNSFKSEILEKNFPNEKVIYPNLEHRPKKDIETLSKIIEKYKSEKILLVGTSLGAYYAYLLGRKYSVSCALVNPSLEPYETLVKWIGEVKNYNTDKYFTWSTECINELKEIKKTESETKYYPHLINVFIGGKDETLNHSKLSKELPFVKIKEYKNENHRFTNFGLLMKEFKKIMRNS